VWKCVPKLYGLMISLGHVSVTVIQSTLLIKFSIETTTIKNVSHYVHLIRTNMLMILLVTVSENAQLDHMLILKQVSENVLLHVRLTIFTLTIQQIDVSANAPPIHSCTQTLMFISVCINAKIRIGSQTIRLKHAFHNALQPGSCGVNVSSTLVCNFVLMVILQMFCRTVNATNNAPLQDSLTSGPPDVWCTAVMLGKITTKIHQQVQVCVCKCAQGTVTDTTLIRHASIRT
jgi:hypothetical protein